MARILLPCMIALLACGCAKSESTATEVQPTLDSEHYRQWEDGAGWHPDYHDDTRK